MNEPLYMLLKSHILYLGDYTIDRGAAHVTVRLPNDLRGYLNKVNT